MRRRCTRAIATTWAHTTCLCSLIIIFGPLCVCILNADSQLASIRIKCTRTVWWSVQLKKEKQSDEIKTHQTHTHTKWKIKKKWCYLGIEYSASAMSAARLSRISFGSLSGSPECHKNIEIHLIKWRRWSSDKQNWKQSTNLDVLVQTFVIAGNYSRVLARWELFF